MRSRSPATEAQLENDRRWISGRPATPTPQSEACVKSTTVTSIGAPLLLQPRPCHVRRGNKRVASSAHPLSARIVLGGSGCTGLAHCNARLQRWIGEVADARPWPDDPSVRVAEVFNTCERLNVLPLPAYRLDTSLRSSVRRAQHWIASTATTTRFPLKPSAETSALATATEIRLFDGVEEIARHDRSYDQGQHLTDAARTAALLKSKRTAFTTAVGSPLHCALPGSNAFSRPLFRAPEARPA